MTLAAVTGGRGPAYSAVLAAVLGHDVLFVEPVGTLTVARVDEAIGLVLLLATATAVTHMADAARVAGTATHEAELSRRASEAKTALLRAVSHDLRTPLATVKASVSSLRQPDIALTDDDRAELLTAIEEETDRLNRLVGNLLDAYRIETGSLAPVMHNEDLGDLVRATVKRLGPLLGERPIHLAIPPDLPDVLCDYSQIDQALTNLIENAARHTPWGTSITVSLVGRDDAVECEVRDEGCGLSSEAAAHLFQPFTRGAGHRSGAGLGLSIAYGLLAAHGSALSYHQGATGGATFRFSLPAAARA